MIRRIITALVLAPVVILLILYLPRSLFAEVLLLVMVIGLFEWDHLTTRSNRKFVLSAMGVLVSAVLIYLVSSQIIENNLPDPLPLFAAIGSVFWILQISTLAKGIEYKRSAALEMGYGILVVLCAWAAMVWLRHSGDDGALTMLVAITVVWAADTFAYFVGVKLGRNKLAPSISPGKSIEGVVGGMIGAVVVSWIGAAFAAAISVVGDLYISRLKRQAGVKDSGKLLPGHGGILDRIDGLLAAMPLFAACWWLLQ
jgi:phosphatidate cytidylyltransferase